MIISQNKYETKERVTVCQRRRTYWMLRFGVSGSGLTMIYHVQIGDRGEAYIVPATADILGGSQLQQQSCHPGKRTRQPVHPLVVPREGLLKPPASFHTRAVVFKATLV